MLERIINQMVCEPSETEVTMWGPIHKERHGVVNQLYFLSDGFKSDLWQKY